VPTLNWLVDWLKHGLGSLSLRRASLLVVVCLFFFDFLSITCSSVSGRYLGPELMDEPLSDVIKNLQTHISRLPAKDKLERASFEFVLGRLYTLAYASNVSTVEIVRAKCFATDTMWPDFNLHFVPTEIGRAPPADQFTFENERLNNPVSEHMQFKVTVPAKIIQGRISQERLRQATLHLEHAITLNPDLNAARMALAWCYEQMHDKPKAISLYREVFRKAYAKEMKTTTGFVGQSLTETSGAHLIRLLDPSKNRDEITDIEDKISIVVKNFRWRC